MKHRILILAIVLAMSLRAAAEEPGAGPKDGSSAAELAARAQEHLDKGRALLDKGDCRAALKEFAGTARCDYFNSDAYYLIGRAYDGMGQRENAFLAWEFAKHNAPGEIRKYFPPPKPLKQIPEVDTSSEHLKALLKKLAESARSIELVRELLYIYETRGDAQNALKYLDLAIELEPDNVDHFLHKCEILTLKEESESGARFCRERLEKLPDNPVVMRELAAFLMDLKQYDEARKHLENALKIEPDDAQTIRNMGIACLGKRDYSRALDYLDKATRLDESDPRGWGCIGFVQLTVKSDHKAAFDAYFRTYKLEPGYYDGENIESRVLKCLQGLADAAAEPGLQKKDVAQLEKLLDHRNPFVRYKVAFSLGRMRSESSVPALRKLLDDPLEDIRSVAQFALGTIGGPVAEKALEEGTHDEDPFVRAWSLFGYTMIRKDAALDKALEFARSELPYERLSAYKSLATMATDRARSELSRLIASEKNDRVRELVTKMLEKK
ncbi:MAG: HEAT repeat domain-containing protein [Planctomycetota bacterium]|nr:HEAT repeat domain-containing protein [Planctomycetota bacterium]